VYHIGFSYKGIEYRKSAMTPKKREAEQLLSYYLGLCARGTFHGFDDAPVLSISEMLEDLFEDAAQRQLRELKTIRVKLKPLQAAWGAMPATHLTERHVDVYIKQRMAQGRAPATINVEMQYLQQAFKLAIRKKLLEKMPYVTRLKVNNARKGFFERDDFERVLACLPDHLKNFARFAYVTGWRKGEITRLSWGHIVDDVIRLDTSKNDTGRILIVVGEIAEILAEQRMQRKELLPWVFHWKDKPLYWFDSQWKRAVKAAGLPSTTGQRKLFHDFRRTAVRNMTRAGVPRAIAKAISGHKTDAVFNRYDIVDEEDIRQGLLKTQEYVAHMARRVTPFLRENRAPDAQQKEA
jgi:integrase